MMPEEVEASGKNVRFSTPLSEVMAFWSQGTTTEVWRQQKRPFNVKLDLHYCAKLHRRRCSASSSGAAHSTTRSAPVYKAPNLMEYPGLQKKLRVPVKYPYIVRDGALVNSLANRNLANCPLLRSESFATVGAWKFHVVHTAAHSLDGNCLMRVQQQLQEQITPIITIIRQLCYTHGMTNMDWNRITAPYARSNEAGFGENYSATLVTAQVCQQPVLPTTNCNKYFGEELSDSSSKSETR
ncbi:unnamed protein product [Thelazia callipaeda]|uniref:Uncharacterized protein n=1 Tax=Thelazia callipaeda TaxID=103827 RepID=A0A0N5D2T6_THECL|nr:unnamed protein product [Thelazia callipaeda]